MGALQDLLKAGKSALQQKKDDRAAIRNQTPDEQFVRLTSGDLWETVAIVDVWKRIACKSCGRRYLVYAGIMVKQVNQQAKAMRWFWPREEAIRYMGYREKKRTCYSILDEEVEQCGKCVDFAEYDTKIPIPKIGKTNNGKEDKRESSSKDDYVTGSVSTACG